MQNHLVLDGRCTRCTTPPAPTTPIRTISPHPLDLAAVTSKQDCVTSPSASYHPPYGQLERVLWGDGVDLLLHLPKHSPDILPRIDRGDRFAENRHHPIVVGNVGNREHPRLHHIDDRAVMLRRLGALLHSLAIRRIGANVSRQRATPQRQGLGL